MAISKIKADNAKKKQFSEGNIQFILNSQRGKLLVITYYLVNNVLF